MIDLNTNDVIASIAMFGIIMTFVGIGNGLRHEVRRRRQIKRCKHLSTGPFGHKGQAMCYTCGAILPDEDPDIRQKG